MKYRFKKNFDLCGWQKLPYAIRYRDLTEKTGVRFIDEEAFEVAKLCNGITDFDLPFFTDKQRQIVNSFLSDLKIIEEANDDVETEVPYTYYDNRYMKRVQWSITGKCNAKCKHCYMSAPDAKYGELDHETALRVAQDICDCGALWVSLTGGECLVRRDFFDIVDIFIKNKVFIDIVYTNGFLVNENLLNEFIKRGIKPEISISFDGVGHHDWMRGIPGAEKMADRALALCQKLGFSTDVEMCLFRANKDTLRATINHLKEYNVRAIKTNPVAPSDLWIQNGGGEALTLKELYDIYLDYIPHYYEDGQPMQVMLGGFFYKTPFNKTFSIPLYKLYTNLDEVCVCGHARGTMYIGPDGRGSTCMGICDMEVTKRFSLVQEEGMKKCLSSSAYIDFVNTRASTVIAHNEICQKCEFKTNCAGGCRASALNDHPGDLLAVDEAACFLFKNGYIDRIKEAVKKASSTDMWDADYRKLNSNN